MRDEEIRAKFRAEGETKQSYNQFLDFLKVKKGDKVVVSTSGKGVYALGDRNRGLRIQ